MPAARLSRSESRELTRRRLLDAAGAVFGARGFEGASLQEIQETAGVSVGSFYHQFKDKTDLFLAVLGELSLAVHRTLRELHEAPAGESLGALARRSLRVVFDFAEQHPDLFRILMRERAGTDSQVRGYVRDEYRRFVHELAAAFARVSTAGGHPEIDLDLAAELIAGMTLFAISRYLEECAGPARAAERARLEDGLARMAVGGLVGFARAGQAKQAL